MPRPDRRRLLAGALALPLLGAGAAARAAPDTPVRIGQSTHLGQSLHLRRPGGMAVGGHQLVALPQSAHGLGQRRCQRDDACPVFCRTLGRGRGRGQGQRTGQAQRCQQS